MGDSPSWVVWHSIFWVALVLVLSLVMDHICVIRSLFVLEAGPWIPLLVVSSVSVAAEMMVVSSVLHVVVSVEAVMSNFKLFKLQLENMF